LLVWVCRMGDEQQVDVLALVKLGCETIGLYSSTAALTCHDLGTGGAKQMVRSCIVNGQKAPQCAGLESRTLVLAVHPEIWSDGDQLRDTGSTRSVMLRQLYSHGLADLQPLPPPRPSSTAREGRRRFALVRATRAPPPACVPTSFGRAHLLTTPPPHRCTSPISSPSPLTP